MLTSVINIFKKIKTSWLNLPKKTKRLVFFTILFILSVDFLNNYLNKGPPSQIVTDKIDTDWQKYTPQGIKPAFFSLKPNTSSDFGILPQETFLLNSLEPITEEFIRQNLNTNVQVDIKAINSTQFEIRVGGDIGQDQIVSFSLKVKDDNIDDYVFDRNYSWAFQTQPKFLVESVLPGNQKINVPLNTGIEIVFNQDSYQDPEKFILINPQIDWKGEKHGQKYSIVPQQKLKEKTLYTVTLKKGLNLQDRSDPLKEDIIFSFQTEEDAQVKKPSLSLGRDFIQSTTLEPAQVTAWTHNWPQDQTIKAKIFKFQDSNQFVESRKQIDESSFYWYRNYQATKPIDTKDLSLIAQADITIQKNEEVSFLSLPEALPSGFYLIQFWYDNNHQAEQLWLQSTNLSAYTSVGRRQTLVWANNPTSSQAIGQALISTPNSSVTYQTSSEGIAVFDTPQTFYQQSTQYLTISTPEDRLVLPVKPLSDSASSQQKTPSDFWQYLYHERYIYKPEDTVNFWGVIKDRHTGQAPSDVSIVISQGYSYYGTDNPDNLKSINVYPSPEGSFIGDISLTDLTPGHYSLNLYQGQLKITSSHFEITDYQKPDMKIELEADKLAIFAGEKVKYTATVSFFDGTPAKNIKLNIDQQFQPSEQTKKVLTTDKNGQVSFVYESFYDEKSTWYPRYENVTVSPVLSQKDIVEGFGSVQVYGPKLSISSEKKQENQTAYLDAWVNQVNLDNLNTKKSTDTKGSLVPNKQVNMTVTKIWWDKIENGTYYDFIEKVTRKSYRYENRQEVVVDTKLKTDNQGKINYQFDMEKQRTYQVSLTLEDNSGRQVKKEIYYYYYKDSSLIEDKYAIPELVFTDQDKKDYSVGDNVSLKITHRNKDYPTTDQNKFLYIVASMGRQDFFIKDTPDFNFEFSQKHIPNTNVSAIIFTGKHYQIVTPGCYSDWYCSWWHDETAFQSLLVPYKKEDSSLDLSISTDKDKYLPGDEAKVTATVKKDGQLLADAQVNLVLVDQALDSIGGVKKPNPLSSLYVTIPDQIYYNYYSHKPITQSPPAAEKGGGGGGDRQIFKDTPFFGQSKTSQNGQATFEFTLPDNITTWLVFAQGITQDLLTGDSQSKLIASKDFFVTSNFPPQYLSKDTAYISANTFGNIDTNQDISYEFSVLDQGQQLFSQKMIGKASIDIFTKFPDLKTGHYQARLRGQLSDMVDGLILPFSVISSRLDISTNQISKLSKGQSIDSLNLANLNTGKPVNLLITDVGQGKYYRDLLSFCHLYSNRIEKKLAQVRANQIVNDRFDQEPCGLVPKDLSDFQNRDGGLPQVVWGSSDLNTTVWAIYTDPTPFDKNQLISYLESKLKNAKSQNQKIYALWGLNLLGQAKLRQLNSMVDNATTFDDKVILAIAQASLGQTEISLSLYQDILANYLYFNKPYYRIQANFQADQDSLDKYLADTGLYLLLGSLVDKTINQGLNQYLYHYSNQAQDIVIDLSRLAYINQELESLPKEDTKVTVSTVLGNQSLDLSKGQRKAITIDGAKANNSKVSVTSGQAEINISYFLSPDSFDQIEKDNRLSIKRAYTPVEKKSVINPGDVVKVNIEFGLDLEKAPLDCYTVTDHLPSGLSLITKPYMYGLSDNSWVSETSKNVIKYYFCNTTYWQREGKKQVTYYAKALAVGNYLAEPAVLQSQLDLSILQSTSFDNIDIEPIK